MKAYSLDLRERIVAACDEGATEEEAALRFGVSEDSVQRYKRRRRETGSLAPTIQTGRTPKIREEEREEFLALVASKTDWSLDSIGDAWQERNGFKPSISVLSDTCKRFKITFKKRLVSPAKETPESDPSSGKK